MDDRELLEMAAKAAGYWSTKFQCVADLPRLDWDPLTDDRDALRLAVKLRLTVQMTDCTCCVDVYSNELDGDEPDASVRHDPEFSDSETADPNVAARRAIVLVAAAIGRTK